MRWLLASVLAIAGAAAFASAGPRREPFLAMLDVGQGDSIVVDAGVGVLVDTGVRGAGALAKARAAGSRPRVLVISHLHEDHAGDAPAVVGAGLAAVLWNGRTDGILYARIADSAASAGVPLVAVGPGDVLRAGDAAVRFLAPDAGYRTSGDPNDTSLVARVDLPGFSALLTGDAGAAVERALPRGAVDVDVLKVSHHGSKGSSDEAFLAAVSPRIALVSSGAGNRYGHPFPEALARLARAGAQVRRSDREGTVRVTASSLADGSAP